MHVKSWVHIFSGSFGSVVDKLKERGIICITLSLGCGSFGSFGSAVDEKLTLTLS